jgi:hypothetical protein
LSRSSPARAVAATPLNVPMTVADTVPAFARGDPGDRPTPGL